MKEAFGAIGKAPAPGFLFLFDKNGVLVWKEVFHRCINQFVAARPLLNHDLHAIDALPARRRGGVGLSAWSRRRREMQSRRRRGMHPTHGLISTQVFTSSWMLKQGQFAEQCALLLAGKPLIDNGARPAADDEDDEGEEIAADLGELDIPGVGDY